MEFALLGQVLVEHGGQRVALGRRRERCLLAVLLLQPNTVVQVDRLVDLLWDSKPPPTARASLHTHVSRLRACLDPSGTGSMGVRLSARDSGYLIEVDPESVDAHRFRALVERSRTAIDSGKQVELLREALSLWRGPVLADVGPDRLRQRLGGVLSELRLSATESLMDAELARGHHRAAVAELTVLTADHPHRERFTAQLMLALYRAGRHTDALTAYANLRRRLVDDLGVEPASELSELHTAILRRDPALDQPPAPQGWSGVGSAGGAGAAPAAGTGHLPVPAQLPLAPTHFTGQEEHLRALDDLLAATGDAPSPAVISAVAGTAGVGKTALAVHWAHRVADRFPDGQLYVNLRGYDPGEPLEPIRVLAGFLRALGVEADGALEDLDQAAAVYRSALAGRRVLVLLDNARTADQVRPLIPATSSCFVLVTSRADLAGLVAREGARRLPLGRLSDVDSIGLLGRILGGQRVRDEHAAATELVGLCAGLPLALRIAAERAGRDPDASLADQVGELRDLAGRLAALSAGDDPSTAVRSVLSWSYRALPDAAARLLRLLALHPGHDLDAEAAAHLAAVDLGTAVTLLDILLDAHLIERSPNRRYQMHDLLRAYAAERVLDEDSAGDRRAALTRLFDHYVTAATAATTDLGQAGHRQPGPAGAPATGEASALAWLDAERANLIAVAGHAAEHEWPEHTGQLSGVLWRYLHGAAYHAEILALYTYALRATEQTGDRAARCQALLNLGTAYSRLGRYRDALDALQRSVDLHRQAGDALGERRSLNNLGVVHWHLGNHEAALEHYQRSLAIARESNDRAGEAATLGNIAYFFALSGRYDEALEHLPAALELSRELDDRITEANTLGTLGEVYLGLGRYPEAVDHRRQSLALARELGDRSIQASALNGLGEALRRLADYSGAADCHRQALLLARDIDERHEQALALAGIGHVSQATGDPEQARAYWRQALDIFVTIGAPEAADLRVLLRG
jgi:DNA-binding SARP family transcriptional activator/tetratricopeptide (TPR) repeat protein